jgi:hypothetical protein
MEFRQHVPERIRARRRDVCARRIDPRLRVTE